MTIKEINAMPTCLDRTMVNESSASGWHESLLRSYHIVAKTKDLLRRQVPTDVILELIAEMEGD